jgi:predicted methyltransferase
MSLSKASMMRLTFAFALLCLALNVPSARAADLYDTAVANPARSEDDVKRDALDKPAELLRLAGIKPGMQVADLLAGGGYYSELLSYVVGPKGRVLMLNNAAFDKWGGGWEKRLAENRLPNVEHRTIDLNNMKLGSQTLDAVLLIKVYHDLYWVDPKGEWPKVDVTRTLDQVVRSLKPGGVLLLVDHSAKRGRGSADASELHRIEETVALKDFRSRGLQLVGESDALRRPEDRRNQNVYQGPAVGKTDRFVMVFRKPGG